MILNAFGNFPERYLLRMSPTLKEQIFSLSYHVIGWIENWFSFCFFLPNLHLRHPIRYFWRWIDFFLMKMYIIYFIPYTFFIKNIYDNLHNQNIISELKKLSHVLPFKDFHKPFVHGWRETLLRHLTLNFSFLIFNFLHDNVGKRSSLWRFFRHKHFQRLLVFFINNLVKTVNLWV